MCEIVAYFEVTYANKPFSFKSYEYIKYLRNQTNMEYNICPD